MAPWTFLRAPAKARAGQLLITLFGLLAAPALSGCLVAGYSSGGGWFLWPGSIGFLVIILLLFFFLRRGR